MTTIKTAAIGAGLLAALDLVSTRLVLALGGVENNPMMVNIAGAPSGVALKLVVTPLILLLMVKYGARYAPKLATATLTFIVAVYGLVVASNFMVVGVLV